MHRIDAAALDAAKGKSDLAATIERYRFFNEILSWHAKGEELAIFPALETVAPLVAEAYQKDHRGLDMAFDELDASYAAGDAIKTGETETRDLLFERSIVEGRHAVHPFIQIPRRVTSTACHCRRWAASCARPSRVIR